MREGSVTRGLKQGEMSIYKKEGFPDKSCRMDKGSPL